MVARAHIAAELCVLSVLPQASCEACASACPTRALTFDDDGALMFARAACTGCAACAAACPAQAVEVEASAPLPRVTPDRRGRVALVCPQRGGGLCAQALGLEALARLWRDGVRQVVLQIGDCATCPNGRGFDPLRALSDLNRLLASRGLSNLAVRYGVAPAVMPRLDRPEIPDLSRRALFSAMTAPQADSPALEILQRQGTAGKAPVFAHVPRIDPALCTACNTCIRICPTSAMTLIKTTEPGTAYTADPAACTGCGLCQDICDEGAVMIHAMTTAPDPITLHPWRCKGCGVPGHSLTPDGPEGGFCQICNLAGHHRRLHWVQK